ncbi:MULTISPECIES: sensor histidine kinase [unclassified Microbacterium]|uniref:sensor histidine kinase n=1 Tax=unclassified Microbacterium TaxID=2609290 RepID=UPI00386D6366
MSASEPSSPRSSAASLARGVSATGWYIAISVVLFLVGALFVWAVGAIIVRDGWRSPAVIVAYATGSVLVVVATIALLARYRRDGDLDDGDRTPWLRRFASWPALVGAAGAVVLGLATGSPMFTASLAASVLCLLRWGPGIRWRGVVLVSLGLGALWVVERARPGITEDSAIAAPLGVFAIALPAVIALSLWSWDVVLELDRARATEARLAAVQERLRLASELHDLQGHHLQVIALQLELAERMLSRDPDAAAHQIGLARASVDEARAGTRALAGRFRGVPLPDELANAADLLRAGGLSVTLEVAADAASAPADLLGPVVRECTTNVLKHGGGRWAKFTLRRDGGAWVFVAANDPGEGSPLGRGTGLDGIAHRVAAVGGDLRTTTTDARFDVTVSVPAGAQDREGVR